MQCRIRVFIIGGFTVHMFDEQVLKEAEHAEKAVGPLRDHRSLCLNFDDHLRCCSVPSKKDANFREMPGVITHGDGAWPFCVSSISLLLHARTHPSSRRSLAIELAKPPWAGLRQCACELKRTHRCVEGR